MSSSEMKPDLSRSVSLHVKRPPDRLFLRQLAMALFAGGVGGALMIAWFM